MKIVEEYSENIGYVSEKPYGRKAESEDSRRHGNTEEARGKNQDRKISMSDPKLLQDLGEAREALRL